MTKSFLAQLKRTLFLLCGCYYGVIIQPWSVLSLETRRKRSGWLKRIWLTGCGTEEADWVANVDVPLGQPTDPQAISLDERLSDSQVEVTISERVEPWVYIGKARQSSGIDCSTRVHSSNTLTHRPSLFFFSPASIFSLCLSHAPSACSICHAWWRVCILSCARPCVQSIKWNIVVCLAWMRVYTCGCTVVIGAEGQPCLSINQAWPLNCCSVAEHTQMQTQSCTVHTTNLRIFTYWIISASKYKVFRLFLQVFSIWSYCKWRWVMYCEYS